MSKVPDDGAITPADRAWKRRIAAYPQLAGKPNAVARKSR